MSGTRILFKNDNSSQLIKKKQKYINNYKGIFASNIRKCSRHYIHSNSDDQTFQTSEMTKNWQSFSVTMFRYISNELSQSKSQKILLILYNQNNFSCSLSM